MTKTLFKKEEEDRQRNEEKKTRKRRKKNRMKCGENGKMVLPLLDDWAKFRWSQCGVESAQNRGGQMEGTQGERKSMESSWVQRSNAEEGCRRNQNGEVYLTQWFSVEHRVEVLRRKQR